MAHKKMFLGVELTVDSAIVRARQKIEIEIAKKVVSALRAAGYTIRMLDPDTGILFGSKFSFKKMFEYDEARIFVQQDGEDLGWVYFVFGNGGDDVISNYLGIELELKPVMEWADKTF